jgi:hypothetical protein
MKLELTIEEAVRLEQAAELMSQWSGDDPELQVIAKHSRSAHRKLQGALERAGCRKIDEGDGRTAWKLPSKRRQRDNGVLRR